VKHLFGAVHGLNKAKWHSKANNREAFGEFLLDLYGAYCSGFEPPKPIVHIVDAILGMEGNGPGFLGTPRHIGAVLAGKDGLALDYAAAELLGLEKHRIQTLTEALSRGYGVSTLEEIDIDGQALAKLRLKDFRPPDTKPHVLVKMEQLVVFSSLFKRLLTEKIVPNAEKCVICDQCITICPETALRFDRVSGSWRLRVDSKKCIRCFCCTEICPEGAIDIKPAPIERVWPR